jgi:hypothetical protein
MTLAEISARYEGHPFLDYFDLMTVGIESAKRRNKRAVQARLAGDEKGAAEHQQLALDYIRRARQWHDLIDWSDAQ